MQGIDKAALVKEVKQALYASKICSYAQGLNIIKAKSAEKDWGIDIGGMARIWKVCLLTLALACDTLDATGAFSFFCRDTCDRHELPKQPSMSCCIIA